MNERQNIPVICIWSVTYRNDFALCVQLHRSASGSIQSDFCIRPIGFHRCRDITLRCIGFACVGNVETAKQTAAQNEREAEDEFGFHGRIIIFKFFNCLPERPSKPICKGVPFVKPKFAGREMPSETYCSWVGSLNQ